MRTLSLLSFALALVPVSFAQTDGFVKVSGQKFILGNSTFHVVGTNAYWIAHRDTLSDIDRAFADLKAAGVTTLRTWGFNDVTSAPSFGAYYQLFSGRTSTINSGSNGLGRFDYVVRQAKANDIRLIVAL
jgi:mannan endo-1,4-beta-mannosidase